MLLYDSSNENSYYIWSLCSNHCLRASYIIINVHIQSAWYYYPFYIQENQQPRSLSDFWSPQASEEQIVYNFNIQLISPIGEKWPLKYDCIF
jgi:hypothetical protein